MVSGQYFSAKQAPRFKPAFTASTALQQCFEFWQFNVHGHVVSTVNSGAVLHFVALNNKADHSLSPLLAAAS